MTVTSIGAMIRREIAPSHVVEHAQAIESAFDELWVVEDLPYAGGISQVTAVLAATEDVLVGHGVAPAPFRNPAALAMEWAALAELYPGRVAAGIGHGVQQWMAQIGEGVASPLTLLAETITAVRGMLAGEIVSTSGRYVQLDGVGLEFPPTHVPTVSAGVTGPKSLRLAGAVADGTILGEGRGPAEIQEARASIEEGKREAGRVEHHRLTVFASFHIGDSSEIAEHAIEAAAGWAAIATGPDAVVRKLQTLISAGADAVILVPLGQDPTAQLQLAGLEVVPHLVTQ